MNEIVPVPCWKRLHENPSGKLAGIVTEIAEFAVKIRFFPLSPPLDVGFGTDAPPLAESVYAVPLTVIRSAAAPPSMTLPKLMRRLSSGESPCEKHGSYASLPTTKVKWFIFEPPDFWSIVDILS
jgi:hypothetical protein